MTDEFAGIHRIALPRDVFAGAKVERRTLGSWPTPRAIKLWPATDQLFLGEGIETVLAAATLPYRGAPMGPAWAAGCGDNVRKFPPLPGVSELILLVDHDANGNGMKYADECRRIWLAAGRRVEKLLPPQVGTDFNDYVIELARAATC